MLKRVNNISWSKENKTDKTLKVILFLISPFFAMLYSLRTMNRKTSYVIFFLFAVFFGMSFMAQSGKTEGNEFDAASYRQKFDRYIDYGEFYYFERLQQYLEFEEGDKDFYFDTLAYFISRMTDNYHVLFMVFAIVFAFFALKTFQIFSSEKKFDTSYSAYALAGLFMINDIFNINGARFWTAAWVGVFCIFQLFHKKNNKYWLLLLFIPFIHGSYWLFVGIITLAYFFRKFEKTWVLLFFLSFAFSSIAADLIAANINLLPPFLAKMAEAYTSEEAISNRQASTAYQYIDTIFSFLIRFYLNYMIYLFIKNSTVIKSNPKTKDLYLFLLVWMSFVNFAISVPSLGTRFIYLAFPVIAYIWLVNFKGIKYEKLLHLIPIIFLLHFRTRILLFIHVLEIEFYFSNPFYLIYKYLIAV